MPTLLFFQMADQPATNSRAALHQASSAVANQLNDFVHGRQPAGLLLGIQFAVDVIFKY